MKIDTDGEAGKKVTQTATVYTNDPEKAKIELKITGNVIPAADIDPKAARLMGSAGDTVEVDIKITPAQDNLFDITEVTAKEGQRKYMAYGRSKVSDYFGPGKDGIKYYVFTSGPHIPPEEEENIFIEGYRGSGSNSRPGTGHGLAFVKNAVELHGGVVGYEAAPNGNFFFFILPE